jgi:quercetin dioxygenase-like cupin family protein
LKYVTLCSDKEGASHFKNVEVGFQLANFAPPAPPVFLSDYLAATRFVFFKTPSGWIGDWHPPPRRQFFCCISGKFEITASDGEVRIFGLGDVFLLEDTTGKGHKSRTVGAEDFVAVIAQIA